MTIGARPSPSQAVPRARDGQPGSNTGTYPLPEAQLDRFLGTALGYPSLTEGWQILTGRMARRTEDHAIRAITDGAGVLAMQAADRRRSRSTTASVSTASSSPPRPGGTRTSSSAPPRAVRSHSCSAVGRMPFSRNVITSPPRMSGPSPHPVLDHRITLKPELAGE